MTDVINYLNQYQAQQPNMLDRDPSQMTMSDMLRAAESLTMRPLAKGERPADPLRWAADYYIGRNEDLPAPQFFMDPRALSVRNMLHSGLGTAANWLDGTKDPSTVGPAEMVSPLGLAGMGTGLANALSRPGRDFRIADDLARQHPGASPVGDIPRFAPLRDASNPTSAAHVYDYGMLPGASRPANVMADNAKGSAPGTVVNSFAEGGRRGGPAIEEVWGTKFQTHMSKEYEKAVAGGDLSTQFDILSAKYANSLSDSPEIRAAMKAEMDRIEPQVRADEAALREELRQRFGSPPKLLADNAKGSAPGTVVNSIADVEMSGPHWRAVSRDQSGNELGFVKGTVRDGVLVIDKSTLNPNEVGKGHGLSMYRALVDKAHEQGIRVDSASTVSGSAARVYDALERRGYRVERGPSEILDDGPRGQKVQTTDFNRRPFSIMPLADNAKGSAPGLAANSTQQDDQGVMSILRRYGLAD